MREISCVSAVERTVDKAPEGPEEKCRVLVVDDDMGFLATMEAILGEHVDVMTCTSGEQALRLLSASMFHMVCSDFGMPGINGAEFLERVAALPYFVSTLLITGSEDYIRTPRSSAHHYVILKPFEPERLVRLVLQLARLARMKRTVSSLKASVVGPSDPGSTAPPSSVRDSERTLRPSAPPSWRKR